MKFLVRKESYLAEQLESYLADLWTFLSPESLVIILITKLTEQFKNFKSSYQGKQQTTEENWAGKSDWFNGVQLQKAVVLSGVGFEPTPTRVDCDLNAAP